MKTVIFFGLLCIADSIGAYTGWQLEGNVLHLGAFLFVVSIITDVINFIGHFRD